MKSYYPVFLSLEGRKILVAGGGEVACRKVKKAVAAGADVLLVSPELCLELQEVLEKKRSIIWIRKRIDPSDIPDDIWLIIAATSEAAVQQMLFHEAERRKIFCNVVDQPEISSFIVPSSLRFGDLDVAMSTGGRSPAVAKLARRELQRYFDWKWAVFLDIAGMFRKVVLESDLSSERKGTICSAMGNRDVLIWISENRMDKITCWMSEISGYELEDELLPVKRYIMDMRQDAGKDSGADE